MKTRKRAQNLNMPYRCPKCGSIEPFYVSEVRLYDDIEVTQDGIDYWSLGHDSDIPDTATIDCLECGATGLAGDWLVF